MLAELQALALVVAAAFAVEAVGAFGQGFVDQAGDDLAVFQHEGCVVGANLEHAFRARAVRLVSAEAGVEEAGIVDAELADRGVDGGHFGGLVDRDLDGLA